MQARYWLTLANVSVIAVALAIFFFDPPLAGITFYVLLFWLFASLFLAHSLPWGRGSVPARPTPGAPGPVAPAGGPLPAPAPESLSAAVGFCIWCGQPLPSGEARCPACGRPVLR